MADSTGLPRRALATARLAVLAAVERRVPFWPPERIERRQRRHVQTIVRHAYATVPFYRETMRRHGLRPDDIATADDLARLPIVERDQVQRDPEAFLSTAHPRERCLRLRSGGSTGEPIAVYHDPGALFLNAAHGERDRAVIASLIGRSVGYRETELAPPYSSVAEIRRTVGTRALLPARVRIERQYLSLLDPPAANARRIEEFKPDVVRGYGSALALLFADLHARGGPRHRPKAIAFSSDDLPHGIRRLIEEEYGIPAFGAYQAIEALKIGFECERRAGYHLNVDLYPVRIVDPQGRTLPAGERGEVVLSNLVNRATVLLNYRLGDVATASPHPCPCGRALPLLASLDGRSNDAFVLPSGRVIHPMDLVVLDFVDDEVRQWQFVQESPSHFRIAIIPAPDADREGVRTRLASGVAKQLGEPVTVDVAFVDAVERTAGGKVRLFISRCGGERAGMTAVSAPNA